MNLLFYDLTLPIKKILITNLDSFVFLEFLGLERKVMNYKLFGVTRTGKSISDVETRAPINLGDLKKLLDPRQFRSIDRIEFSIDDCNFLIADNKEFHINSYSLPAITEYLDRILNEILKVRNFGSAKNSFQNCYLVFEGGKLIETFETFDQFLESPYD